MAPRVPQLICVAARLILETGGSKRAWVIHWIQGVIIFSFLALAWASS